MMQFESVSGEASKRLLPPEIEKIPATSYANRPAEFAKFQVVMHKGKRVIIDHYFIGKGLYIVSEMLEHPGKMNTYPISPDELTPIETAKH